MNIEQTILGYLRIATVSPKVYPGEVKKNLGIHKQSILELLDKDPGIKLIVFPELSLTGYTCGDLFLTTDLIRNTQEGISELTEFVKTLNGPVVIFGAPTTGDENSRLYNSAIIVGKSNEPLIINKTNLLPSQVNIICADDGVNEDKLKKIGHSIGKIPLRGESNKMFTFCTKTAYIGSDFYSDCASSYVFADPNIKSLALDISLDLPQIVGRQRNRENPFKNNIVIFYKTKRKDDKDLTEEEFKKTQEERRKTTKNLLDIYNNVTLSQQKDYLQKLKDSIEVSKYERDFVSISKKTGEPVYNSFIEIAQERSWEVSQKDYQDKISVTKSLESLTSNISEYQNDLEKEVQDFLDNKFYSTGIFKYKMRMYCQFMDLHQGNKEVSDIIYFKIKDPKYRKYYNFYGTSGCKSVSYEEKKLELGMIDVSKESELSSVVHKKFQIGSRYTLKEIKSTLQDIYRDLGITSKPKATDLDKYFNLTRTKFSDPKTKKRIEGYLLKSL